ncbi:hypothetical protein [Actinopolymorpha alba]|uniref:hypothetical protein n=1 Tax=Actinopolymorpha alba TaxID=533267 RepID=UPI00036C7F6F|nr:hypothetical protein [Actinopolymorpha alba]
MMSPQLLATIETGIRPMRITFVAKDPESNPTGSPTLYRTDRGSWLVQGWVVDDAEALAEMDIPKGETCVEIPDRMIQFFGQGERGIDNG